MPESAKWQVLAWAVAAAVVVYAGARMLRERAPEPPPVQIGREHGAVAEGGRPHEARDDGGGGLFVHVAGAVRRPGLLRVPQGARVALAIDRAGGPVRAADLSAVNLAQPLEDGQQVIVPRRGAPGAAGARAGAAGADAAETAPSLATASQEQLEQLDGIGPALAARIIEYRDAHGGFRSLEELREVDGIGEKRFAALRDALRP